MSPRAVGDGDTLEFGRDIVTDDITVVARSSGEAISLYIGALAAGNRLDLRGLAFGTSSGIDEFGFVGTTWGRGDITGRALFSTTAGITEARRVGTQWARTGKSRWSPSP